MHGQPGPEYRHKSRKAFKSFNSLDFNGNLGGLCLIISITLSGSGCSQLRRPVVHHASVTCVAFDAADAGSVSGPCLQAPALRDEKCNCCNQNCEGGNATTDERHVVVVARVARVTRRTTANGLFRTTDVALCALPVYLRR